MIEQWFQCPSCGKGPEELCWRITTEHFEIYCAFCESEVRENIESQMHSPKLR